MKPFHIMINSNKWFSAVSDYSLQLADYLNRASCELEGEVLYLAHEKSPNLCKAEHRNIKTAVLPLLPSGVPGFFRSWLVMTSLLKKSSTQGFIWVFEGREHTLCAIHKFLCPALWKHRTLVRVRGQAAQVKKNFINRWLYESATPKVVFAADIVKERTPFALSGKRARVQHYACDISMNIPEDASELIRSMFFLTGVPEIDFSLPTLLVVGRYDPVKAHPLLLEAFVQAEFTPGTSDFDYVQLVFVGESQNTTAHSLFSYAREMISDHKSIHSESRYFIESSSQKKRVYIFDERVSNIRKLMNRATFGVIPSLASEVICRVAVEFLQSATPLLVSNAGALSEIVTDECGHVFKAGDVTALRNSLEWGFSCWVRDNSLGALRAGAKNRGKIYSLESFNALMKWVNT